MKSLQIDTLRGLACMLLVLYHVIGADANLGLRIETGPVRWLNDGLVYLRMPLFTFLSGLVYGLRPFGGNSRAFLLGKVRRLLIPLFALIQASVPDTQSPIGVWYLLHVQPVAHFWFVESLFWVFLVIWALERRNLIADAKRYLLALGLSCALYLTVRGWHWFGLEGAMYLRPYFLLGLAFSRFPLRAPLASPFVRFALAALAMAAIVSMGMPVPNPDRRTVGMLLIGMSLCALSLSFGFQAPWLARIGRHSYAIYLLHVFFTASVRLVLSRASDHALALDIVLALVIGITGPMLIDRIASRSRWPALLLLGKSVKPSAVAAR